MTEQNVRAPWLRRLCAALIAGWVAACGGGGGGGSSGGGSDETPPGPDTGPSALYTLSVSTQPLVAQAQADDARAVEHLVPPDGGTLTVTGADGTVYTLHIPSGALPQGARIRMAPLAALQVPGIEGEAAYGVDLGPSGLAFYVPAQLTIEPPAGVAMEARQQIPVSWSGAANTVSLAALDPASATVRLQLMHFSGYAILFSRKGMTSSILAVRDRLGGSAEDRIASASAEVLARDRQRAMQGQADDGASAQALAQLRRQFVNEVLLPRLAVAATTCAASRLATQTLLSHGRTNALLGIAEDTDLPRPYDDLVSEQLAREATTCIREEYEICRDEHIITRILPGYLAYERLAALLGGSFDATNRPPYLLEAEDLVRRCLQFELQFDSAASLQFSRLPRHTMHERVESRVRIGYLMSFTEPPAGVPLPPPVYTLGGLLLGDFRPLAARDYAVAIQEDCAESVVAQPAGGALAVGFMGFTPVDPYGPRPVVADLGLSLAFQPGSSQVRWQQGRRDTNGACTDPQPQTRVVNWFTEGVPLVAERFTAADVGLYVTGWNVNHGSDILATKDLSLNADANGERTTLTLNLVVFHTPL